MALKVNRALGPDKRRRFGRGRSVIGVGGDGGRGRSVRDPSPAAEAILQVMNTPPWNDRADSTRAGEIACS
jgi:hypothetical protein